MGAPLPPDELRCMVIMRNAHEPCWRLKGHFDAHRSRYAMENQRRAKHLDYVPAMR